MYVQTYLSTAFVSNDIDANDFSGVCFHNWREVVLFAMEEESEHQHLWLVNLLGEIESLVKLTVKADVLKVLEAFFVISVGE